ncbi:phosphohydrolase [Kaustia mangrovi]|uniref:Phosphohydrolase n=1 Tax=Kaustia mangrovi TaxID=2593653 RepID=A0A7S8C5Y7_9HYPH|nr:hypothetical protein [Kaustia mangrovi]QPC43989.1 phosphohydrolase [Kaustia mangrovi]
MIAKPDICIYHHPCLDGFAAALAVWLEWGDEVEYRPATYGKPLPLDDVSGKNVLFVDFCGAGQTMWSLVHDCGCKVTVLDHHKTAKAAMEELLGDGTVEGVFDMERSGCGIAWDEIHGGERPRLINHLEDRDLWRFALSGTREFFAYIASYHYDFDVWNWLRQSADNNLQYDRMLLSGSAILGKQAKDIAEWLDQGTQWWEFSRYPECEPVGPAYQIWPVSEADPLTPPDRVWRVPVVNAPYTHGSDAAHELLQRHQEAPFAAYYWDVDGTRRWGLRSADDREDVSAIAKARGGGGHRNAAGFEVAP